jgi:glycosyltransferase involved in cell wall biosynthesis
VRDARRDRLRICLIASSRFPVREPFMGGMEAHTHALAKALLRRGHEVSLFAAPGSDPELGSHELPVARFESSLAARLDVASPPEAWMREHHAYLDLMLALARHDHGSFDVVHNNSVHHLPVAMSRAVEVPVVTTLHTPPVPWLESALAYARPGSRFVAVSRSVARAWRHVTDADVIHNGVDTGTWTRGPGGTGAVWSGRIVPEKAPHEALEAAALAGMPIDVAGPVHDQAYFEARVQPLLHGEARYVGHLDAQGLRELVGSAAVAVVTPRWDEPFGLVAAEALACGTPVAAYDAGALSEIVDLATGRLVRAGDRPALATAMVEASGLDRAAARRRAQACFSHERMVDDYERTYREVSSLRRVG